MIKIISLWIILLPGLSARRQNYKWQNNYHTGKNETDYTFTYAPDDYVYLAGVEYEVQGHDNIVVILSKGGNQKRVYPNEFQPDRSAEMRKIMLSLVA